MWPWKPPRRQPSGSITCRVPRAVVEAQAQAQALALALALAAALALSVLPTTGELIDGVAEPV